VGCACAEWAARIGYYTLFYMGSISATKADASIFISMYGYFWSKANHRKEEELMLFYFKNNKIGCLFNVIINIRHIPDGVKLRHFRRFFKISQRYWSQKRLN
jgi:hypothetical protein